MKIHFPSPQNLYPRLKKILKKIRNIEKASDSSHGVQRGRPNLEF